MLGFSWVEMRRVAEFRAMATYRLRDRSANIARTATRREVARLWKMIVVIVEAAEGERMDVRPLVRGGATRLVCCSTKDEVGCSPILIPAWTMAVMKIVGRSLSGIVLDTGVRIHMGRLLDRREKPYRFQGVKVQATAERSGERDSIHPTGNLRMLAVLWVCQLVQWEERDIWNRVLGKETRRWGREVDIPE